MISLASSRVPGAEPSHALGGGAVREGFRRNAAPRLLLEPVVANGGGGREAGLDVAWPSHERIVYWTYVQWAGGSVATRVRAGKRESA